MPGRQNVFHINTLKKQYTYRDLFSLCAFSSTEHNVCYKIYFLYFYWLHSRNKSDVDLISYWRNTICGHEHLNIQHHCMHNRFTAPILGTRHDGTATWKARLTSQLVTSLLMPNSHKRSSLKSSFLEKIILHEIFLSFEISCCHFDDKFKLKP